jgi:hypothetical protein
MLCKFNRSLMALVLLSMTTSQTFGQPTLPEDSPSPVRASSGKPFLYRDATQSDQGGGQMGVEPKDVLNQWLRDQQYKCLSYEEIAFSPGNAVQTRTVQFRQFNEKRYVVICDGDCLNLNYLIKSRDIIFHFGRSQPYPVLHLRTQMMGYMTASLEFSKATTASATSIRVFQWSNGFGDYGGGCKLF